MRNKWMTMMTVLVGLVCVQAGCNSDDASNKAANKAAKPPTSAPATMPATGLASVDLSTPKDKISYSLGVETARNMKKIKGPEINLDAVVAGFRDAVADQELKMTDKEIFACMESLRSDVHVRQGRDRLEAALDNKKEGEDFLAANKAKAGVVALPSGLQYQVIKAGTGPTPVATDTVQCNYRGTLINGTEFDSSYVSGKPASIKVNDPLIIAGWREALKLMPVGSTWKLFIPSRLAYLGQGTGRLVGPNATLIYEVELVGIEKQ